MRVHKLILSIIAILSLAVMPLAALAAGKELSGGDKKFVKEAASGSMMEVQLGQIAKTKAQAQEVKDFGDRMVTDHTKASNELTQLVQQKNMTLSTKLEHKHQSMLDKLRKVSGADFDKQYMAGMVKDHEKDVKDFRDAAAKLKDPDLKAWAQKTLPVLEQHLQLARETAAKVGATSGTSAH